MQQVAERQTKLAVNEGTSYGISLFSIKFLLRASAGLVLPVLLRTVASRATTSWDRAVGTLTLRIEILQTNL